MENTYREKLAHLVMVMLIIAIVGTVCWYLKNVLIYIALALVLTLLAMPFRRLFAKIHIGKHSTPDWLCAVMAIISVFAIIAVLFYLIVPVLNDVAKNITFANISTASKSLAAPFASINEWVCETFSSVGTDFKVENKLFELVHKMVNVQTMGSVISGMISFLASLGVAIFVVVFIAFFFIKTPSLFKNILTAVVPDRMEEKMRKSIDESGKLISRYFVGISIEVVGVWMINFIGLWVIAQMGFKYSLSIAFLVGIMNIIPYIGPLIGGILGVGLSLILHYSSGGALGLDIDFLPFAMILTAIFVFTQIIDNYVYQPVIYSNSVKVHPLEIFFVFLVAAELSGMVGILVAVPSYTILRVLAHEFFGDVKPIRLLTKK